MFDPDARDPDIIRHSQTADEGILPTLYRDAIIHLHCYCESAHATTTSEIPTPVILCPDGIGPIGNPPIADDTGPPEASPRWLPNGSGTTRRTALLGSSLTRLRAIFDAIPAFVGLCEPTGRMMEVNKTVLDATGLPRDDYVGKRIWDLHEFTHSTQSVSDIRSNLGLAADGKPVNFQTRARTLREHPLPIDVSFIPVRDPDENTLYILAFGLDISERLDFESRLRETIEHLKEAQSLGQTGSWTWDIVSDRVYWSDEVFRQFGIAPQAFEPELEAHFMRSLVPEDRSLARDAIEATRQNPSRPLNMEIRVNAADGATRVLKVRGVAHCDRDGHATRMTGTSLDVTESRVLEQDRDMLLARLNRASHWASLGEIAAGVAHEINQPLAAIRLYADGCVDRLGSINPDVASLSSQLEEIAGLADRCGEIVKKIKDLAESRQSPPEVISVQELFDSVRDLLAAEAREKRCQITTRCQTRTLSLRGDRIQLQQALSNLVRNSLEAFDEQAEYRRIHLNAERDVSQGVTLTVTDWGPGVPPELVDSIFTPFYTTKPEGMGIGLRICCKIAESHGGALRFRKPPHRGAEFAMTIPVTPATEPKSETVTP